MKDKKSKSPLLDEYRRLAGIRTVKTPPKDLNDLFGLSCEEVSKYLETYWKEPSILASSLLARISMHLKECEKCQEAFVKIMDENPIIKKEFYS